MFIRHFYVNRCSPTTWSRTQVPNTSPTTSLSWWEQPSTLSDTVDLEVVVLRITPPRQRQLDPVATPLSSQPTRLPSKTCQDGHYQSLRPVKLKRKTLTSIRLTILDLASVNRTSLRTELRLSATLEPLVVITKRNSVPSRTRWPVAAASSATSPSGEYYLLADNWSIHHALVN